MTWLRGAWRRELLLARCLQAVCCQPRGAAGFREQQGSGSSRMQPSRQLPPAGLWTFLWFVGFCFLTNQWAWTHDEDVHIVADSARAVITFSFFSIFSWVSAGGAPQGSSASCRALTGSAFCRVS